MPIKSRHRRRTANIIKPSTPQASYMTGEKSPFMFAWNPQLRDMADDVRVSWQTAAARTIETVQNSGWIAGAVDQSVAYTVGPGLRLASKPDVAALGWTSDRGAAWAQAVERRWEAYADRPIECDIEGKSTIGKLSAQALRSHFCFGELLAAIPYVKRPGLNQYGTKVQMLSPLRLRREDAPPRLTQGIFRDQFGFPIGYRINQSTEQQIMGQAEYTDRDARDPWGRTLMVHVFDGHPGQMRGIPPITPVLKVVRQFDQLSDATLVTALIQTIFAATIKSPEPTDVAMQAFQDVAEQRATAAGKSTEMAPFESMLMMRQGWYEKTDIDLGSHGKIAHLAPGDELAFHASQTPNSQYDPHTKILLREIARCLGITFEDLTGDYSGATYSSVRMAGAATWMMILYRRVHIVAPFLNAVFEAWLEEDIENGWTPFPGGVDGYIANRAAASRAHWRGPAKPQADDLKFSTAIEKLRAMGVISDEWICAEMGEDWEDVYEQRAREMTKRKTLGLPELPLTPAQSGGAPLDGQKVDETGEPINA